MPTTTHTQTDAEIVAAVARTWQTREAINARPGRRHRYSGVEAHALPRITAAQLARLARAGLLVREYDPTAGDAGCYVYRPA